MIHIQFNMIAPSDFNLDDDEFCNRIVPVSTLGSPSSMQSMLIYLL
jgi:hypothetical protein